MSPECPALFEAARPDVYRRNAFRILALSVEAKQRDIDRRIEEVRLDEKWGKQTAVKTPLPLNPAPDVYAVREAAQKLQDPEKRLIDEFFWFWPQQIGQDDKDEALELFAKGDVKNAAKWWAKGEQSSDSHVSGHNLAVLYHCLALDAEHKANGRALKDDGKSLIQQHWEEAFKRWKTLSDNETFWDRLSHRIRSLKDPRLTTGLSRRIRENLPLALLSINANLAVCYTEQGNADAAKRQLTILRMWEASKDGQQLGPIPLEAISQAVEPFRRQIHSICKNIEARADADPIHADQETRNLIAQTKPMLRVLDGLLPTGDTKRDAAHDEVALCALRCQIPYGNKTENWEVSLELLELALPIALGQDARDRIEENIKIVKNNLLHGTCWFCRENRAVDAAAIELKMYGDVTRTPTWNGVQIQWRHASVKVPRCENCKKAHEFTNRAIIGGVIGGLIGFVGFIVIKVSTGSFLGAAITFGVFLGLGIAIGARIDAMRAPRPKVCRPEAEKNEFPRVKELLAEGWQFGEKPDTAQ